MMQWEESNYCPSKKPSFDRLNPLCGYSFENIQLKTWGENRKKADWEKSFLYTTAVDMFDVNGKKIRTFESVKEASSLTGFLPSLIIQCCQNRIKTAKGYVFKYRGDKHRTCKTEKYCNVTRNNPELLEGLKP